MMKTHIKIAVTHRLRAKTVYEIALELSQMNLPEGTEITISFGFGGNSRLGGLEVPKLLNQGLYDLAFVNPSSVTYLALNGLEPYHDKIAIRNLAVFPSWDRMGFAVKRGLGVKSLKEIRERRIPLKLSTRAQTLDGTAMFTIHKILNLYGWKVEDVESWGGKLDRIPSPRHPARREGLMQNAYDAVFDEGLSQWAEMALAQDMIFLPLEDEIFREMGHFGFRKATIPKARFRGLQEDIPAIEFSGWALYCRADIPDELAYMIVKAIDRRKEAIPVDADRLDMSTICKDTEEGPLCIPLHAGAESYYRDHGYL